MAKMSLNNQFDKTNITEICRACLQTCEEYKTLFDKAACIDKRIWADVFSDVVKIEIISNIETAPNRICITCSNDLTNAYNFIKKSQQNNERLLQYLNAKERDSLTEFPVNLQNDQHIPDLHQIKVEDEASHDYNESMVEDFPENTFDSDGSDNESFNKSGKIPKLECGYCNRIFTKQDLYENHMEIHREEDQKIKEEECEEETQHNCEECGFSCYSNIEMIKHQQTTHTTRLLQWSSSSSDEDLYEEKPRRRPRNIRVHKNPFTEFDDYDFKLRFRVSKQCVEHLLALFGTRLQPRNFRNNPVSAKNQVLITLRFYATGSFQISVGDMFNVHRSTVCRIIEKVTHLLASLRPDFISMPTNRSEITDIQNQFHLLARFPNVIGAVDCTHIRIQSPGGEQAEVYRNQNGWFSINTQCVCDAKLKFLDIVARWPGSAHDSNIFDDSLLRAKFENNEYPRCYLLGDSGYAYKNYLLTPLLNPRTPAEKAYNKSQIKTRKTIEKAFGVWKRRFPCLSMGMRVKITSVLAIIVATAVLHNIAIELGEEVPPSDPEVVLPVFEEVITPISDEIEPETNVNSSSTRTVLIDTVFSRR